MERGTDEELAAVRREWRALERQRRVATHLLYGLTLLFGGLSVLLFLTVQPQEWCLYSYSPQPDSCTTVRLGTVFRAVLVGLALVALAAGGSIAWQSLQPRNGNGHRVR
ncbi:hypothetical protein [Halorarius litoreus]|uniref:hypothetical protein n=1 Tax=Halorarius litoreus TaxID=2962676 RepID=UPI0020CC1CBF|nr:hypothetical protein [Halorarius litoreus]